MCLNYLKVERIVFYLNEINIDFEDESALAQVNPKKLLKLFLCLNVFLLYSDRRGNVTHN